MYELRENPRTKQDSNSHSPYIAVGPPFSYWAKQPHGGYYIYEVFIVHTVGALKVAHDALVGIGLCY